MLKALDFCIITRYREMGCFVATSKLPRAYRFVNRGLYRYLLKLTFSQYLIKVAYNICPSS